MGTRLAPSFANIYMYHFENKHVYPYNLQPNAWYRYIDDIFMVWNHGRHELMKFIEHLNSSNDSITFSSEISKTSLNFLDVTVKLTDSQITTDLYINPMDRNTYLPYDLAHPKHCMKGLPYGQFLCIRRICSAPTDFERHSAQKAAQLLQHGYPKTLLLEAMMRAHEQKREDPLIPEEKPSDNEEQNQIFLTTMFNKDHPGLREQVESTWELLGLLSQTRFILDKTLKVSYRRPKSLNDLLVRARLPPETRPCQHDNPRRQESNKRCKKKNCRYCQCLNTDGKIHSHATGKTLYTKKGRLP